MEKLIELLNEYAPEDFNWCAIDGKIFDKSYEFWDTPVNFEMWVYVISKQFWFIKWLVEKDKIDREKVQDVRDGIINYVDFKWDDIESIRYKVLLMLLAIQDSPLEFLISILK